MKDKLVIRQGTRMSHHELMISHGRAKQVVIKTQHINKAIWIGYPAEIIHSSFPATNHPLHLRNSQCKKKNST